MMKSKNAPQTLTSRLIVWLLPPLFAISIFVIQGQMDVYTEIFLSPDGPGLPYIPFIVNDLEQDNLLRLIGLSLFVIYISMLRKQARRVIMFWAAGTACLLCMAVFPSHPRGATNTIIQSLSANDHTYYLIQQRQVICHPEGCGASYIILECDSEGWTCHTYGSPFSRGLKPRTCFVRPVSLVQNPTTQTVELLSDVETRPFIEQDNTSQHTQFLCFKGLWR